MTIHQKMLVIIASIFGASSIGLAASAAHGLHDYLVEHNILQIFYKATTYEMYGALSILAIVALQGAVPKVRWYIVGYIWAIAIFLFSGTLLLRFLFGIESVKYLTPTGGTLFIIGWIVLAILALFAPTKFRLER